MSIGTHEFDELSPRAKSLCCASEVFLTMGETSLDPDDYARLLRVFSRVIDKRLEPFEQE